MARRYRCTNCGNEFVSERQACVACDIDATHDPVAKRAILPLALIHYDPPHPKIQGRHTNMRACDPKTPIGKGRGTGEARHVNCDACKATPAYQQAVQRGELNTDFLDSEDEIVTVGVQGVVITKPVADCPDCPKE